MQIFEGDIGIGGGEEEGDVGAVEKDEDGDEERREVVVQVEAMENWRVRTSSAFEMGRAMLLSLSREAYGSDQYMAV